MNNTGIIALNALVEMLPTGCPHKLCRHSILYFNSLGGAPSPPLDNIRVMMIVWGLRANIIRTALCWIV